MRMKSAEDRHPTARVSQERRKLLLLLLLLVFLSAESGCRHYEQPRYPGDEAAGSAPETGPYRLIPGDVIDIEFPFHPEWNATGRIRPDGRFTAPFVGEVQAAGKTLDEVRGTLEKELARHIQDPQVLLDISEFGAREIFVGGEVMQPGVVTFDGRSVTLLEAIMRAGGWNKETAYLKSVIVARDLPDGRRKSWVVDLSTMLEAAVPPQPVHLLNHDVVLVPNTAIDEANIFVDKYINRMIPGGPALALLFFYR